MPGPSQKFLLLLLIVLSLWGSTGRSQELPAQSQNQEFFNLFEISADQEGMFYQPSLMGNKLYAGSATSNLKQLETAIKDNNYNALGTSSLNLGLIALENDSRDTALSYFQKAQKAFHENKDFRSEARASVYKAFIYYLNLEFETAAKEYNYCTALLSDNGMTGVAAYVDALIAQSWFAARDYDKSTQWFLKSYNAIDNQDQKSRIGVQLAELAIRNRTYDSAIAYLESAKIAFQRSNNIAGQAMIFRDKGIIQMKQLHYDEAIKAFESSVRLSSQLSTAKLLKEAYLKKLTMASLTGEHDLSNKINIIYVQLRDSLDKVEQSRIISSQLMRRDLVEKESIQDMLRREKGIQYSQLTQEELERNKELTESELERLEKERIIEDLNIAKHVSDQANLEREEKIRLLTQEKSLQDLAISKKELLISQQAATRNSLIIGFVALVIVSLVFYNRYRNQKKSHLALDKAYTELSETHQKLLNTQEQLVHAQKMASLGELTAGIAHEIQNPLNFVNNFSEISLELISELNESGTNQESVLNDLATNLEKINYHGKRADKIVKGMLLHSRSGSTEKQPVNLNATIDELLELSYHGSRKRDNALETVIIRDFDPSLPEVDVIINSISRVLVNLFNNSLYAIETKAKNETPNYTPLLKVSTKFANNCAIVTIWDNGSGIPGSIINKIFDPFFTTKPAGQGTGLGLSLSYDIIVNGHNGSISVNSEESEFTEFVISLPVKY